MISFMSKTARTVAKGLATTEAYKYSKGRAVWYWRVLLSPDFSKTMTNLYNVNKVERDLNNNAFDHTPKKVFHISPEGDIYDIRTGDIYGNVKEPKSNRYNSMDDADYNNVEGATT